MAPVGRALFDGALIGAAFAIVALTSLLINPMAWIGDYPPDVQAAVTGSVRSTTTFQALVSGALIVVVLGGYTLSLRRLGREVSDLRFGGVVLHVFLVYWVANAFDVVVTDWLFFMHVLRRWVILPGTEGLAGYDDYFFHFQVSFLEPGPWVGSLIVSLGAGFGWWLLVGRRRVHVRRAETRST